MKVLRPMDKAVGSLMELPAWEEGCSEAERNRKIDRYRTAVAAFCPEK